LISPRAPLFGLAVKTPAVEIVPVPVYQMYAGIGFFYVCRTGNIMDFFKKIEFGMRKK
jgi:hypothetical protein